MSAENKFIDLLSFKQYVKFSELDKPLNECSQAEIRSITRCGKLLSLWSESQNERSYGHLTLLQGGNTDPVDGEKFAAASKYIKKWREVV